MTVKNQDIALLDLGIDSSVRNEELTIINCRIERLSLSAVNFQKRVTIDSCIIGELNLCATWLIGGCAFLIDFFEKYCTLGGLVGRRRS